MSQEQPSSESPSESLEHRQDVAFPQETDQKPVEQNFEDNLVEDLADVFSGLPSETNSERIFADDFFAEASLPEESLLEESLLEESVAEESVAEEILVEEVMAERSAGVHAFLSSQDKQRSISQETFRVSAKATPVKAQSQTLQILQEFWQKTQPRLKTGAIAFLKGTIHILQGTVDRLEHPNSPQPTQKKAAEFWLPTWVNELGQTLATGWTQFWRWWKRVLPSLRRLLPTPINEAVSDQLLSAAIAGTLVLVLSVSSSLLSSNPAPSVAIAPVAPEEPAIEKKIAEKKVLETNVVETNVVETNVEPAVVKTPVEQTTETNSAPNITTPSDSKPISAPVESPPAQPTPPPLKLTPEQKLIAQIQDQVADVSDQSAKGLIQSVQANFRSSRLTVNMGEGWYRLSPTQQTKLANDILSRTQQLNFTKLELVDPEKKLLARSPVVGTEMVILRAIAEPA